MGIRRARQVLLMALVVVCVPSLNQATPRELVQLSPGQLIELVQSWVQETDHSAFGIPESELLACIRSFLRMDDRDSLYLMPRFTTTAVPGTMISGIEFGWGVYVELGSALYVAAAIDDSGGALGCYNFGEQHDSAIVADTVNWTDPSMGFLQAALVSLIFDKESPMFLAALVCNTSDVVTAILDEQLARSKAISHTELRKRRGEVGGLFYPSMLKDSLRGRLPPLPDVSCPLISRTGDSAEAKLFLLEWDSRSSAISVTRYEFTFAGLRIGSKGSREVQKWPSLEDAVSWALGK